jgi:hypothetical protein
MEWGCGVSHLPGIHFRLVLGLFSDFGFGS